MVRILVFITFAMLIESSALAQPIEVTTSGRVDLREFGENASDILAIHKLWTEYLNSRPDSLHESPYWSRAEQEQRQYYDLAGRFIYHYVTGRQRVWKPHVLSIEPRDSTFEIQTAYLSHDTDYPGQYVWAIQKVLAVQEKGEWRLHSPLKANVAGFKKALIGNLQFIYPSDYQFDSIEAMNSLAFVDSITRIYELEKIDTIEFYISRDRDEMYKMLGLPFLLPASKGFAIAENRQVFSSFGSAWYPHELAHALFRDYNATMHPIMLEGIATYIGGGSLEIPTYQGMLKATKHDLKEEGDFITLDQVLDNPYTARTPNTYYATGAWLCRQLLVKDGARGLKHVLKASRSTTDLKYRLLEVLGIEWNQLAEVWLTEFLRTE
jgi:hypothetical protein